MVDNKLKITCIRLSVTIAWRSPIASVNQESGIPGGGMYVNFEEVHMIVTKGKTKLLFKKYYLALQLFCH